MAPGSTLEGRLGQVAGQLRGLSRAASKEGEHSLAEVLQEGASWLEHVRTQHRDAATAAMRRREETQQFVGLEDE